MKLINVFVKKTEQLMQAIVLHHSSCADFSEPEWCVVNVNNVIHIAWRRNGNWVVCDDGLSTIYDPTEDEATGEPYCADLDLYLSELDAPSASLETSAAFSDGNCGERLTYGRWCATCKYDGNCPIQVGM